MIRINYIKIFITLSLIAPTWFAQKPLKCVPCLSVSQSSEIGTKCQTSKGIIFERVKGGWKDKTSNITWYDWNDEGKELSQYGSETYCKSKGQLLPTKSDFELAESHDFREVCKDMKSAGFWSSSLAENDDGYAYYFIGHNGEIDWADRFGIIRAGRDTLYYNVIARCVCKARDCHVQNPEKDKNKVKIENSDD